MPSSIKVTVTGTRELSAGLQHAVSATQPQLRATMERACLLIEADARSRVAQDTRHLMGSITHRIRGTGATLVGEVGPSRGYGVYVEFGRRPGKPPPVSALMGWAHRHNMNPYALARAIGRRGIRPKPFMRPAFETNKDKIAALFDGVARIVVGLVSRG